MSVKQFYIQILETSKETNQTEYFQNWTLKFSQPPIIQKLRLPKSLYQRMRFCQQLYQNIKLENRITRAPLLYVAQRYQQRKFNFMYFLFSSYFQVLPLLPKLCAVLLCWAAGIWNGRPIRSNAHKRQKLFYCC